MVLNTTGTAYSTVASLSAGTASWLITGLIFISVLIIIFLLSKNFRNFMYGAIFSAAFFIIGKLSRWIGTEATIQNNPEPMFLFIKIAGFICLSIVLGMIARKIPIIKKFESKMDEEVKENEK